MATSKSGTKKREATTGALLRATGELIAEKGIDGFTLSDVARLAGVNRALIYHYFQNRESLIVRAIDDIIARNEEGGDELSADAVESSLRLHIAHPEISRVFFQLLLNDRPLLGLGERLTSTIDAIDRYKREQGVETSFDVTFALITLVLAQFSWPLARDAIADILRIPVEEADERFIANLRFATDLTFSSVGSGASDA